MRAQRRQEEFFDSRHLYLVKSDASWTDDDLGARRLTLFIKGIILGIACFVLALGVTAKWAPDYVYVRGVSAKFESGRGTPERLIASGLVTKVAAGVKRYVVTIETKDKRATQGPVGSSNGVGAGVVLRSDGFILTNEHVIAGAKSVLVRRGNRHLRAVVIGADKSNDIAVIKVDARSLPTIRRALAGSVRVGQLAVAVGAPFGFSDSVSAGVISGVDRTVTVRAGLPSPRTYRGLLQTDAAINPGNSGGPLVDSRGRFLGMNSLIYTTTGFSQGVGFAIPMQTAVRAADVIISRWENQ